MRLEVLEGWTKANGIVCAIEGKKNGRTSEHRNETNTSVQGKVKVAIAAILGTTPAPAHFF